MTDSYQAIYDAIRSRITNGNVGHAIQEVARQSFDISFAVQRLEQSFQITANEQQRPSVLYRPDLSADGTKWMALYGGDLQSGIAGFGDTPAEAMTAFDKAWWQEKTPTARRLERESEERDVDPGKPQWGAKQ